nr:Unknown Function [uncultured bacterium]
MAAARQKRYHGARGRQLVTKTELFTAHARMDGFGKRVAHKLHVINAPLLIPLALEGKNREQQVNVAPNVSHAMRAPSPELRADVVDDARSIGVKRTRQSQIEVRPVNQHYRVRFALQSCALKLPVRTPEARQRTPNLRQPHYRESVRAHG